MITTVFIALFSIFSTVYSENTIGGNVNQHNDSWCYTVIFKDGSATYCNITKQWEPTIKKSHAITAGFVIAIVGLVFICYCLCRAQTTFKSLCCSCKHNAGCCLLSNFVVTAFLRIFWKVADVAVDVLTYYNLGSGKLIDIGIYRNSHMLNSLLAFTCVGIIATLITIRLIHVKADELKENGDVETLKLLMILISFLLEDGIQMFLEYYWIQKYVTIHIPWYLVAKDFIIAILAFHSLLCSLCILRSESSKAKEYIFFAFGVVISLAEFLRVGAVIKQYNRGNFRKECLMIDQGRLWQQPFDENCMDSVDYWILVLTFLPFVSIPFLFIAFRSDLMRIGSVINIRFSSRQLISDS